MKRKKENSMKTFNKERVMLFTVLIFLFTMLNYIIIVYGHSLTFDLETNNCTHMSERLETVFEFFGIPVTIVTGSRTGGASHMWISLWNWIDIDSVTLLPFRNGEYHFQRTEYGSFDEYEKILEL